MVLLIVVPLSFQTYFFSYCKYSCQFRVFSDRVPIAIPRENKLCGNYLNRLSLVIESGIKGIKDYWGTWYVFTEPQQQS
jgi:hypothetical protein